MRLPFLTLVLPFSMFLARHMIDLPTRLVQSALVISIQNLLYPNVNLHPRPARHDH
jgi:hypothetical protein